MAVHITVFAGGCDKNGSSSESLVDETDINVGLLDLVELDKPGVQSDGAGLDDYPLIRDHVLRVPVSHKQVYRFTKTCSKSCKEEEPWEKTKGKWGFKSRHHKGDGEGHENQSKRNHNEAMR